MPYAPFLDHFPSIAERETRTVVILESSEYDIPPAEYIFLEMFCDEPDCDCRRVFFYVVSSISKNVEAVLTYGWESDLFYRQWLGYDDPLAIIELKGPSLNIGSPQSPLAPALLDFFRNVILPDASYIDRVKNHYKIFRDKVAKKKRKKRKNLHNKVSR